MLCKLLKHDFWHSARAFLPLGGVALGVGALMAHFIGRAEEFADATTALDAAITVFVGLSVASLLQIFRMFNRGMFGNAGYLALTLPCGRGKVMASKLIVSYAWYVFSALIAAAIMAMMVAADPDFSLNHITIALEMLIIAPGVIAILIFCTTLAYSTFGHRRVYGLISGLIGFTYAFGGVFTLERMGRRPYQFGLQHGRLLIAETPQGRLVFLDIWQFGVVLGMSAVAIAATYYLLKRRVSL